MARPRTDIRPRILAAARARFLAEGVDGASLRAIAKDAGSNIGMVYYYFPTKDDLFLGVVEETYALVMADLEQVLADERAFEPRVRALYARIGRMSAHESEVFRLVVREAIVSSERLGRLMERFKRGHVALALRLVLEGRQEGAVTDAAPLPLVMIATIALGVVPQAVLRALGARAPFADEVAPGEGLVDPLVRLLLGGIGARGG